MSKPNVSISGVHFIDIDPKFVARNSRKFTLINCWHMSEHESDAMWRLFGQGEAVAIKSTISHLIKSFDQYPESVFIGQVNYLDFDTAQVIPPENIFWPYLNKRLSFSHEKEVRAVMNKFPLRDGQLHFEDEPSFDIGLPVPVNLAVLIDSVHVSPIARVVTVDLVESLMDKFEMPKPVTQSDLRREPEF